MKHFLEPKSFSKSEYNEIFKTVEDIIKYPENYSQVAKGKILATLFYEASTRTRLSFESAMLRLGGQVLGFSDASTSSVSKGETVEDTSMTVSIYSDIIAMRHPKAFEPHKASKVATVPVVNAGDGANEHPTQTLTDLITIKNKFGRLNNLTIGLCGDLKYGRTVHSLVKVLSEYKNNTFILISPDELKMPREIITLLKDKGSKVIETSSLDDSMQSLDVLYMTRVQRERFSDIEKYESLKGIYILTAEKMKLAKNDMIVMHPLPRVDEIDVEVDSDARAWYFKQAKFGMYGRMALIIKLLGLQNKVKSVVDGYELIY